MTTDISKIPEIAQTKSKTRKIEKVFFDLMERTNGESEYKIRIPAMSIDLSVLSDCTISVDAIYQQLVKHYKAVFLNSLSYYKSKCEILTNANCKESPMFHSAIRLDYQYMPSSYEHTVYYVVTNIHLVSYAK